jgi:hypothetical protein
VHNRWYSLFIVASHLCVFYIILDIAIHFGNLLIYVDSDCFTIFLLYAFLKLMEVLEALESRATRYWLIRLFTFYCLSAAIGGPTGEILESNAQVLSQISTNLSNMQVSFFFNVVFWAMIYLYLSVDCLLFQARPLFFLCYFIYLRLFSFLQIQDNISLLCQTRDNILRILKEYVLNYCCIYSNTFEMICSSHMLSQFC